MSVCSGEKRKLIAVPMNQKDAAAYISEHHRHLPKTVGDVFRVACACDGNIVGVITVGRPVARMYDHTAVCQVLRLCTDGTENVCSFLYARACRIAKQMGYKMIITYTLESELGTSLKASGWINDGTTHGGSWNCPSRARSTPNLGPKKRWYKILT
jgi:hypothetical protein